MKKFVTFIVLSIITVSVLFIINMGQSKSLKGTVKSVDSISREIVVTSKDHEFVLQLSHTSKILDSKNMPSFLGEINPGFEVAVDFHIKNDTYFADTIKILKSPNIILLSPGENDTVSKEILISGIARTFENNVILEVVNPKTKRVLVKTFLTADAKDIGLYGDFETTISLELFPYSSELSVSAFQYSAKDGSIIDRTTRLIKIAEPIKSSFSTQIYFADNAAAMEGDCSKVVAVERVFDYGFDILNRAVEALVKGPTGQEESEGLSNSIPSKTKVNYMLIENNVLNVDFNENLQEGIGGSCLVSSIFSQVTETLKALGPFNDVLISINGKTEDILQP